MQQNSMTSILVKHLQSDNSSVFTLAVFRVSSSNQTAFVTAWEALCLAFLRLPQPPASSMTLIQSTDNPEVFQSLGAWYTVSDVKAMRNNPEIIPLMNAMVAFTEQTQPGVFQVVGVVPRQSNTLPHSRLEIQ
jgi:hypothetical protein